MAAQGHHHHHHGNSHGQGHDHGGTRMDWAEMIPMLERGAEVYAPMYRDAMDWLRASRDGGTGGGTGLIVDAGAGPGAVTGLLAEAFGQARIVAADPEEALLARAAERAGAAGLGDRVSTLRVELPDAVEALPSADLIWAARSLHHVGDQAAAVAALAGRLAPGGTLALVEGGLPARCLPRDFGMGRPGLQARLDALEEDWFARMRADLPGARHDTENWAKLLTGAGLARARSRTFLLDLPAPLDAPAREHVVELWHKRREVMELTGEDAAVVDRLLDPDDPESLHRRDDLFLLVAHTVHTAVKDE
ncbi:class I SAM-dependent methyltransferase [Streptomyces beihaiensis]|uniref:Methyltransferase domain-containing protein n=1 Tax=Streptomyces beihaiensis TaxID=2984495 RepID=A0ABT3TRM8_9ACTN|nr:methyltransferase [Streptomyces beihaiensis]MCX3059681.1 methyltransferase domain-containing protein [Streptomyces beihaiensis]